MDSTNQKRLPANARASHDGFHARVPRQQTRHNFVGEIRIFSVKICINPYPSFLCIDVSRKRSNIAMQFAKKSRHCVNKSTASSKEPPKSELYVTWRDSRIRPTLLIDIHAPRETKSPVFFRQFSGKASCVDDKTVLFRYTYMPLFINCFSVICLKSVSQRDTAVSSQKRPKSEW